MASFQDQHRATNCSRVFVRWLQVMLVCQIQTEWRHLSELFLRDVFRSLIFSSLFCSLFNRLVIIYQDLVYNQALRVMGDAEAAQDATQEAFISAYRHIKSYRGGAFRAWLLRIVTNSCYDELRRRQRRPTTPLEPQDEEGEGYANEKLKW
jgi:hypothetical protein